MKINRKKFFDGFRPYFKQIVGKALTVTQVANLEFLLGAFEKSTWFSVDVRRIAYAIATIHIETYLPRINSRYAPVTEGGSKSYFNRYDKSTNPRKARELGNIEVGDGYRYRGRGYCQITGRNNYRKFGIEDNPEMALDPQTAFNILERGMREGTFTGKKIIDYINTSGADYKNARRVINGQDRAAEIAGYARNIEHFLREAISGEDNNNTTANAVTAPVADPPKSTDELTVSSPDATQIEQTVVEEVDGTLVSTTTVDAGTVTVTSPEPYQGMGFIAVIKRDIAAIGGGNLTFQGLSEYGQQASGWPEWLVAILTKLALVALGLSVLWIIYRLVHYTVDSWKKAKKVEVEAAANTDKNRFNIEWS